MKTQRAVHTHLNRYRSHHLLHLGLAIYISAGVIGSFAIISSCVSDSSLLSSYVIWYVFGLQGAGAG